jgi:hypothetical protein
MSDITLIVNGTKIPAHKLILSAKSKVFEAMFYGVDMVEKTAKELQIKDTNTEAFYLLLKFIYTKKFDFGVIDYEMTINVFKIAHRFRIERLVLTIEEWFIKKKLLIIT